MVYTFAVRSFGMNTKCDLVVGKFLDFVRDYALTWSSALLRQYRSRETSILRSRVPFDGMHDNAVSEQKSWLNA